MTLLFIMRAAKFLFSFLKASSSPRVERIWLFTGKNRSWNWAKELIAGSPDPESCYMSTRKAKLPLSHTLDVCKMTELVAGTSWVPFLCPEPF